MATMVEVHQAVVTMVEVHQPVATMAEVHLDMKTMEECREVREVIVLKAATEVWEDLEAMVEKVVP